MFNKVASYKQNVNLFIKNVMEKERFHTNNFKNNIKINT